MKEIKRLAEVVKQFMVILSPAQKRWGLVVFVASFGGAIVETLGVSAILPLVQAMLEPEVLMENIYVGSICAFFGITDAYVVIVGVAAGVAGIYVLKNIYLFLLSYIRVKYSVKVQRELSLHMLHSYMKRGYSFFRINNTSTLLRGINTSVVGVYTMIYNFMRILAEVLTITCIFAYVVYTDWQLALSMIGMVGLCLLLILYVFKGIMKRAGEKYYKQATLVNKWALQLFAGIKEILVLNRREYFVKNYEKAYIEQQNSNIKQTVAAEAPVYIIEGACVAGVIIAFCFRINAIEDTAAYLPQLAAFAMAAFRLLPSVGRIAAYFNNCVFHVPAVEEVYNNIIEAREYEKTGCVEKVSNENNDVNLKFNNTVEIKNIVWKYPDGIDNVLDHISISINKGESVALVGPSGAGKSTLADIILGLFHPQEGGVLIDGINILDNKAALSKIIGFVPQSVYLIDDTVRRNIAFGLSDEEIDDNAVWSALEQAQMKDFVNDLPNGLDTIVGERGVRFSGGQIQRLAIARALYTNPDILVLDEATSALDTETEMAVMSAIDALQGQKTLIIIAHRLTTIKNCNSIYEINNGKAVKRDYSELI